MDVTMVVDASEGGGPPDASDGGPPPVDAGMDAPPAPIALVQHNMAVNGSTASSLAVKLLQSQHTGDLIVVAIGWADDTSSVTSVTDTVGNTYKLAVGPNRQSPDLTQYIYYASGISAASPSSNTITAKFGAAVNSPDLRVAEFSGLSATSPLDVTAGANGKSATASSGAATTTTGRELLFGAGMTTDLYMAANNGFTLLDVTTNGNADEYRIVSSTGSYTAGGTFSTTSTNTGWVMQLASFR
jgi:hypothetical protein